MSRRAVTLWLALAIAAGAALVWRDVLWDWKRQWDASREFAALVGDPSQYEACFAKDFKGAGCERWQIKAQPNPEYWPYPDKPPFVWPEAPKQQVYKPGMSRVEYFEALCKAEAGEFIYKSVKAEGIYMIRPRMEETEERMRDRYGMEDPYGYGQGDTWDAFLMAALSLVSHPKALLGARDSPGPRYSFLEMPYLAAPIASVNRPAWDDSLFREQVAGSIRRLTKSSDTSFKQVLSEERVRVSAEVGFTWRGIRRPFDRELGISGGEVVVVDLRRNEILGRRRGFMLSSKTKDGRISWLVGRSCPFYSQISELGKARQRDKDGDYLVAFLNKVAIPNLTTGRGSGG